MTTITSEIILEIGVHVAHYPVVVVFNLGGIKFNTQGKCHLSFRSLYYLHAFTEHILSFCPLTNNVLLQVTLHSATLLWVHITSLIYSCSFPSSYTALGGRRKMLQSEWRKSYRETGGPEGGSDEKNENKNRCFDTCAHCVDDDL